MGKPKDIIEIRNFKGTREQLLRQFPQLADRAYIPQKPDNGELDGLWIAARHLDEEFSIGETYDTREAAIAGAVDDLGSVGAGETFCTGQLSFTRQHPRFPIGIERLIEDVGECMYSEWSESSIENWTDKASTVQGDLEANIEKAWDEWVERHKLFLEGYTAEDVEQHTMPAEDEPATEVTNAG